MQDKYYQETIEFVFNRVNLGSPFKNIQTLNASLCSMSECVLVFNVWIESLSQNVDDAPKNNELVQSY